MGRESQSPHPAASLTEHEAAIMCMFYGATLWACTSEKWHVPYLLTRENGGRGWWVTNPLTVEVLQKQLNAFVEARGWLTSNVPEVNSSNYREVKI